VSFALSIDESKHPGSYADVAELLSLERPREPVYCIYPHIYRAAARQFVAGFPGRVLYAVKANDHSDVVRLLFEGGVRHFDCASIAELALVHEVCPGASAYFMVPVRLRGAAAEAFGQFGVRHFMVDHMDGIGHLEAEIDLSKVVVFVRMAVHHAAALQDLSSKFGAPLADVPGLIQAVAARGAEPALAFNVGSSVIRSEAYTHSIEIARAVLADLPFRLGAVDIGGGFPHAYPGFSVPPLEEYFETIAGAAATLPLAPGGVIMSEPGRSLAAPGMSAIVEVLLRKDDRLYLNDGMYGIFWELRFHEHEAFPARVFREGHPLEGRSRPFRLYGPTCDASDVLPGLASLPQDIRAGDHIEFGSIGAYSLSGRTRFNGHFSERIVHFSNPDARPPV